MLSLKEVTKDNLLLIIKLQVKDNQKGFVATNAISIAQAHYSDQAWFRAIYFNNTPVGFVMLSLDDVKKQYWIWRFMIDQNHQQKGYGKAAVKQVIDFVKTKPNAQKLMLSFVPEEGGPKVFYEKLGFAENGKVHDNGEVEMELVLR